MARKSKTKEENIMSETEATGANFTETPESTETPNGDTEGKRARKLEKDLVSQPGKVVITVLGGIKGAMVFDPADLSEDIQQKLIPFGLGHKLGDAAAGKSGTEAEEAIEKVWEGLKSNDWSVRAPATPKVSLKDIASNFANLSDEDKEAAAKLMASLGINLPGIS